MKRPLPLAPRRRYPQIYASEEKLLLDAKSVKVLFSTERHWQFPTTSYLSTSVCVFDRNAQQQQRHMNEIGDNSIKIDNNNNTTTHICLLRFLSPHTRTHQ